MITWAPHLFGATDSKDSTGEIHVTLTRTVAQSITRIQWTTKGHKCTRVPTRLYALKKRAHMTSCKAKEKTALRIWRLPVLPARTWKWHKNLLRTRVQWTTTSTSLITTWPKVCCVWMKNLRMRLACGTPLSRVLYGFNRCFQGFIGIPFPERNSQEFEKALQTWLWYFAWTFIVQVDRQKREFQCFIGCPNYIWRTK